jgi:hypothetical protein
MVTWGLNPRVKIEAGATEISTDGMRVAIHRPENAVSCLQLTATNTDAINYIGRIDAHTIMKASLRYGSDPWVKVFEGAVEKVAPLISASGYHVQALAYGYGAALRLTHCDRQYGAQISSSFDTPVEIWDDLVDNYVNKSFGGAATGYAISKLKIKTLATPTIPFLDAKYAKTIDLITQVADFYTAAQAGSASVHWFVDPSKNLHIDTIGNHGVDTTIWPTWWDTNQATSTLVQGTDFHRATFTKRVSDLANKVVVFSDFRKPGYDWITEDGGPAWGNDNLSVVEYSNTEFIVESHSLHLQPKAAGSGVGEAYYPSTEDAAWDITAIGSSETIPTINLYTWKDNQIASANLRLFTTDHDNDYYNLDQVTVWSDPNDTWIHHSIPIGPYWKNRDEARNYRWTAVGAPDWTDINGIAFNVGNLGAGAAHTYIDDLHLAGKIIREALNSTSIAAVNEFQKTLHMTVAVDDTLKASDATGTAGRIAYAELLRRQTTPIVGTVTLPLMVSAKPGQLVHIHSDRQAGGTFRVDADMRIKEATHTISEEDMYKTTLDLTSDVTNTRAVGMNDLVTTWQKMMYLDVDAQNLKGGGIDTLIPRLTKDYP